MAHAVDDRTPNPELQVASFRDAVGSAVWMADPASSWQPDAESTSVSGPHHVLRVGANSGYSYLDNDDGIGVYRIEQHPFAPRLRWLIARYQ
jgi:hypothetical protein